MQTFRDDCRLNREIEEDCKTKMRQLVHSEIPRYEELRKLCSIFFANQHWKFTVAPTKSDSDVGFVYNC